MITLSVVDRNPVNQEALRLLLSSVAKTSPKLLGDFFILSPAGEVDVTFTRSIAEFGVSPISYQLDRERSNDPYRAKFLMCSFFNEWHGSKEYCLYLDPDHIALRPLSINYPKTELLVSSEMTPLSAIQPAGELVASLNDRHYNTSLILGHVDRWREVLAKWQEAYRAIAELVPTRFLEEIAFAVAAKQASVTMQAIASSVQGNFCCFDKACSLFHYGGDSLIAMRAKRIIGTQRDIHGALLELRQELHIEREIWFLDSIISILSQKKETV